MKKIGNEKSILSTYIITTKTYALIPTRSTDHQTKVIEEDHTYYVNQSPLELIKLNCLLNGSDFTGRAKSITYHLNFKRMRSEEHTSELQSRGHLVCRLLLDKKKFVF